MRLNLTTIAALALGGIAIFLLLARWGDDTREIVVNLSTPAPTLMPPAPTPTPIAPPVGPHRPAVRMAWFPDSSHCGPVSGNGAGWLDAACGDWLENGNLGGGEASPLGAGLAHFPTCPGAGGDAYTTPGRYVMLTPTDYPQPTHITFDGLDQFGAFALQNRSIDHGGISYRAYITYHQQNCRLLGAGELLIDPHPAPTPTPLPTPTPSPTPGNQ